MNYSFEDKRDFNKERSQSAAGHHPTGLCLPAISSTHFVEERENGERYLAVSDAAFETSDALRDRSDALQD